MMMKMAVIAGVVVGVAILLLFAVPTFAARNESAQGGQVNQQISRPRVLARLLLIQDEAKVNAMIDQAQKSGRISAEQASKITELWTEHHAQFGKNAVLTRLIWAQDGSRVQASLNKAVDSGKIGPSQSDRLMAFWTAVHEK